MNNALLYGAVIIVAIVVFAGAVLAENLLASPTYNVGLNLTTSTTGVLYPYQSTAFNIIIANRGGREVSGLLVAFYVNGNEKNFSTYSIPSHQNVTIQEIYTYTQPGNYLFSAAADPGNVLKLTNASMAKKNVLITVAAPEPAEIYSSVPNYGVSNTETFTTSGVGLLSASLMAQLYSPTGLSGINGADDNGILTKTYQDLYPYVAVVNGAYLKYANGTASYVTWLQGSLSPRAVAIVISSFGKKVTMFNTRSVQGIEYSSLSNNVSLCSYYENGWTKIIEFDNQSNGPSCLAFIEANYTPSEGGVIANALGATRIGASSNTIISNGQVSWKRFYYNNATVLGQTVDYGANQVAASTLFQLASPSGVFLSTIDSEATNVLAVNNTCLGLESEANGASVCSIALPNSASLGNQSYGAVYSKFVSSNYTVSVYSLIGQAYLALAHANAAELISGLGIRSPQVNWTRPFKNSCSIEGGLGCSFESAGANSTVSLRITNLNYSSVLLDNATCSIGEGFSPVSLNTTISRGDNVTISIPCHTIPIPVFAAQTSFTLTMGLRYRNSQLIVNGTVNVTTS